MTKVILYAYVLMDNYEHLLVETPFGNAIRVSRYGKWKRTHGRFLKRHFGGFHHERMDFGLTVRQGGRVHDASFR